MVPAKERTDEHRRYLVRRFIPRDRVDCRHDGPCCTRRSGDGLPAWRVALASILLVACGMGIEYLLWSNVKAISSRASMSTSSPSLATSVRMLFSFMSMMKSTVC